ncbi:MAG: hypothetical protein KatS3mg002_0767 [Candidatus Woesearchaeota archaeon]|nr:MAG: hypothetical protein KatS3mg002_0767 [Candidatus Woesearchaeota archaeon]
MGSNKPQKKPLKGLENVQIPTDVKGSVNFTQAVPAKIEEIIGRTGTRGESNTGKSKNT